MERLHNYSPNRRTIAAISLGVVLIAGVAVVSIEQLDSGTSKTPASVATSTTRLSPPKTNPITPKTSPSLPTYPVHANITATEFWVGEPPDADNHDITNVSSAWVDNWVKEFGGVDSPTKRCGYNPCSFTPKENPFYFALPFNDYDANGNLKPAVVLKEIPWYTGPPPAGQSLVKNRWIAVTYHHTTVYAQWEDVGPFGEDDQAYVFGNQPPKVQAGLDLSPAANDYLKLEGEGTVSWHFVDSHAVPNGPWKKIITASGLNY